MQRILLVVTAWLVYSSVAFSFEDTKVLPKGVRSVNMRRVTTSFDSKTDREGVAKPLGQPLAQDLTFAKIVKGETGLKREQVKAFLAENGFNESDSVGAFTADLRGQIAVFAPIMSYGVSERFTIALAAPFYQTATDVSVGFRPNSRAQAFVNSLAVTENNQTSSAREAGGKLNRAVGRLNEKLIDHDFRALERWSANSLGDVTLAGKFLGFSAESFAVALTTGVVAPTGKPDDPNILNDIPSGDGQWDIFEQIAFDEKLPGSFTINQFAKATYQMAGKRDVRAISSDEKIEVPVTSASYKLGDKFDLGTAVKYEPEYGLVLGAGLTYARKLADEYRGDFADETAAELEKGTDQLARNAEMVVGYSTIPLFRKGVVPVPLDLKLTYVKQLASRNMPVTDLAQIDFSLFF